MLVMSIILENTQNVTNEPTLSIELIISIVAIIISVVTLVTELFFSNRNNKINLEAHFFTKIFDDYLITQIPEKRKKMTRDSETGKITGVDEFYDVLVELRQGAIYYKFKDKDFYINLFNKVMKLEEMLDELGQRSYDEDSYDIAKEKINAEIEKLYLFIADKYVGKIHKDKK